MATNEEQFKLKIAADTRDAVKAVQKLQAEVKDIGKGTKSAVDEWQKFNAEIRKSVQSVSNIKAPKVATGGGAGGQQIGDIGNAANAFAALTGELDAGSQAALKLAGDLGGAVEQIPRAASAFTGLLSSLNPVTAVLAGVAVGVGVFVASIIASQEELNKSISAAINANADIERKIAEGLTVDQATTEIERLTSARQAELDIIAKEKESREQAANAAASQFGILSGAVLGFVNATSSAEQTSADVQQQATDAAAKYQAEIDRLTKAVESGELATNEAVVAEQALAAERERTASATADAIRLVSSALASGLDSAGLAQKVNETTAALEAEEEVRRRLTATGQENTAAFEASLQRTESLTLTLTELESATTVSAAAANTAAKEQAELAKEQLNAASSAKQAADAQALFAEKALEGIAKAKAESDKATAAREAAEQAHQDKLKEIADRGAKAIAEAQADLVQKQIDAVKRIAQLQADFAHESLKAQQNYEKERLRRQRDFETARQRLEEDFLTSRFDAILEGDIAGALRAERDFKTTKKRGKQDFKTDEGDIAEDFAQEQAERAEALALEIAAIQTELAEYMASVAAKILAIQQQTAQELAIAQDAYNQKIGMDTAATQAINANAQQASNLKLSQIQQESTATSSAHQSATAGINAVNTAAQRLIATALAAQRAATGGSSVPPRASQGGQGVRPFAEGGIVKAGGNPILGLFERKRDEAVVPLQSELGRQLFGRGGMGGGSPQLHIEVNVDASGANGSPEDTGNKVVAKLKEVMPSLFAEYTRRFLKGTSQT